MPSPIHLAIEEGRIQLFWLTNSNTPIVCEKLLRYSPGQNWVTLAHWDERIVIAKLFSSHKEAQVLLDNASILLAVGIKTLNILYDGWTKDKSLYVILLEQLESAQNMYITWQMADDVVRVQLLQKLIQTLVKMHQTGLQPKDLELKNFLLKDDEIYVERLTHIQVSHNKQPLPELVSLKNLALLLAQLSPEWDLMCDKFYSYYVKERDFAYTLASFGWFKKAIIKARRQRLLQVDKAVFKTNNHWIVRKKWQRFWICDRGYDTDNMQHLFASPTDTLARLEIDNVVTEDGVITYKTVVNGTALIIKRYDSKNLWQALKQMFTGSPAATCWRDAQRARSFSQAVPKPVALIEMRFGPLPLTSYFIAEDQVEKHSSQNNTHVYAQYA